MQKLVCALAIFAAASTAALAKDLKQENKGVAATRMSDAEMDRVTAGALPERGAGIVTAQSVGADVSLPQTPANLNAAVPVAPGNGTGTIGKAQ